MYKKCVSLYLDADTWARFQGISRLTGITPSSIVESLFRAFLSNMRAGDDLRLELASMISSYVENKDLDSEFVFDDLSENLSSVKGKKVQVKKQDQLKKERKRKIV